MVQHWQTIIGLEIHAQLKTESKMFCSCRNNPEETTPNLNVCEVCLGHPGSLPVINQEAVKKVIKTGLAFHCQIPQWTKFDRKNYFYPDLPKGYQISQYDQPLAQKGWLEIQGRKIRITRIHLEEDTGRLVHLPKEQSALVDFNRAGIPLMEMVTEPDLRTGEEVREFAKEFQLVLRHLGVSEADMEKGQMRVEVNISLIRKGEKLTSGTKVEVKNLNSFRAAKKAVDSEIIRQKEILERGEKVIQETRGWNGQKTVSQRKKEEAADYRYFPEPDLPAFSIDPAWIEEIRQEIPELPSEKRERLKREYQLSKAESETLIRHPFLANFFEKAESELKNWAKVEKIPKTQYSNLLSLLVNYLLSDFQGELEKHSSEKVLVTPENFAELVTLVFQKKLSSPLAKKVLKIMFEKGADPSHVMEEEGLEKIEGDSQIEKLVQEIIKENSSAVADYRRGKEESLQFLLGQLMRKTRGQIDPQLAKEKLQQLLQSN
jgi:aspartyl-tRNA(Asn)/glutamyl-tRNA(Gln) amidotransferase subunit B